MQQEYLPDSLKNIRKEAREILEFWFVNLSPSQHFVKDPALDQSIGIQFQETLQKLSQGEYKQWLENSGESIAACIGLDQFPRNIYRGTPESFAQDANALIIAKHIRDHNFHLSLPKAWWQFCFLPFMHSECLQEQKECMRIAKDVIQNDQFYRFSKAHHDIIEQFGRFPHRNAVLSRKSSNAEIEFLKQENSSF